MTHLTFRLPEQDSRVGTCSIGQKIKKCKYRQIRTRRVSTNSASCSEPMLGSALGLLTAGLASSGRTVIFLVFSPLARDNHSNALVTTTARTLRLYRLLFRGALHA